MDLGDVGASPSTRGAQGPPGGWESLTPTELRSLSASEGLTNAAIAKRMFISAATVKLHLAPFGSSTYPTALAPVQQHDPGLVLVAIASRDRSEIALIARNTARSAVGSSRYAEPDVGRPRP